MDPIQPLGHGRSAPIARMGRQPVDRAERVSRDRDRPSREAEERGRRKASTDQPQPPDDQEDERPHIDVRA